MTAFENTVYKTGIRSGLGRGHGRILQKARQEARPKRDVNKSSKDRTWSAVPDAQLGVIK